MNKRMGTDRHRRQTTDTTPTHGKQKCKDKIGMTRSWSKDTRQKLFCHLPSGHCEVHYVHFYLVSYLRAPMDATRNTHSRIRLQNKKPRLCTSKGSYRSWKKIVKVWIMMRKEGIFAGHPSLALPPPPPRPDCPCLTCPCPQPACHPPPPLTLALLTLAS